MKKSFAIFLLIIMIASGIIQMPAQNNSALATDDEYTLQYYSQVLGFEVKQIQNLLLYDIIDQWMNTPYRYAGQGEKGIDCSHFVITVYASAMSRVLEGSSADIFEKCQPVKKNKLQEGDLVFFRIHSKRISHVGIYLGENKFVHASTKSGVIISDLDEPYYHKYFKSGGRFE